MGMTERLNQIDPRLYGIRQDIMALEVETKLLEKSSGKCGLIPALIGVSYTLFLLWAAGVFSG